MVVGQSKWTKSGTVICIYDITFSSPESGQQALILHPLPPSPSARLSLMCHIGGEGVRLWAFFVVLFGRRGGGGIPCLLLKNHCLIHQFDLPTTLYFSIL